MRAVRLIGAGMGWPCSGGRGLPRKVPYTYFLVKRFDARIPTDVTHVMTPPKPPIDDPNRRRLPPLLRRCWYGLNQAFRKRLATLAITPNQFTLLRWLEEDDGKGIRQAAICERMASDPNTIAALVERMHADGLVKRKVDPTDRRARLISSTPKGRRIYAKARPIAVQLQEEVLEAIPAQERERLLEQIEVLADACQAALEAEPQGSAS